jgi:hypothetical protein
MSSHSRGNHFANCTRKQSSLPLLGFRFALSRVEFIIRIITCLQWPLSAPLGAGRVPVLSSHTRFAHAIDILCGGHRMFVRPNAWSAHHLPLHCHREPNVDHLQERTSITVLHSLPVPPNAIQVRVCCLSISRSSVRLPIYN